MGCTKEGDTIYEADPNEEAASTIATLPTNVGFSAQPRLKGEATQEEYTIAATGQITITVLD